MTDIFTLEADIRNDLGKGASRRLRRANQVPAILYGAGKEAVNLSLHHNKVIKAQENEAFYSHVLTLVIGGEKVEAILKDVQRHPYKPKVTHLDFLRVDATQKLHTTVPLHFINEDTNEAVKAGGVASHHVNEVDVSCLPADLPEFIEVDLAGVEMGQTLHLSDLVLPEGVTSVELAKGEGHDNAVVTIKLAKGEVEESAEGEEGEESAE